MKQNHYLTCPYGAINCHGFRVDEGRGVCVVLEDVRFSGDCPFYKDKAQLESERIAIKGKLMLEGRKDLIDKYYNGK